MGLATPWFLAGLGLLGLPLYLHLLRRHNANRLPFSSLMFFERSTDTSVRKRRLTHLLLLAARLALLALIVFAFTRPFFVTSSAAGAGNSLLLVVIDDSASMGAGSRMEDAKRGALEVLAAKPASRPAQVAAFASRFRLLGGASEDTSRQRAMIQSLHATGSQSSYGELANSIRTFARSARRPVEVHLFTDLQRTSMPPAFAALRLEPGTTLKLHPVAAKDEENWFVEDVRSPGRLLNAAKHRVEVVVGGALTPAASRTVRLLANGREVGRKTVQVPAAGRATAVFEGLDIAYGFGRCEAVIDESDALAEDNRFLFSVEKTDPRAVLFVGGARAERSLLFLRNALDAAAPGAWRLEQGNSDSLRGLAGAHYAAVVLADPGAIEPSAAEALENAVRAGLPALVVAGPAAAATGRIPVTGDAVKQSLLVSREGARFLSAGGFDLSHPALEDSNRWEGVRFFQAVETSPKDARVLARLGDRTPLLFEKKAGAGTVLVLASAMDNLSNDLPSHPAFVAFADNALNYLAGGVSGVGRALVDDAADLRSGGTLAAVEVLDPDGKRALSLEQSAKATAIPLERAGFWEIRSPGGRSRMIAVNVSRRESDLTRMPPESAELWQGAPAAAKSGPGAASSLEARKDIWHWILAAALLAAALELFLASRHMKMEATT